MAKWRKADKSLVQEFRTDDGENFLVLRDSLTKIEANHLMEFAPTKEDTAKAAKAAGMLEEAFGILVVDWSLTDDVANEDGSTREEKVLPTVEAYREIQASDSRWIDETIFEQLQKLMGIEVEDAEGKVTE